jgi:hypothetical protein
MPGRASVRRARRVLLGTGLLLGDGTPQRPGDLLMQDERVDAGGIGALEQAVDVGRVRCPERPPAGKPISRPRSAIVTAFADLLVGGDVNAAAVE